MDADLEATLREAGRLPAPPSCRLDREELWEQEFRPEPECPACGGIGAHLGNLGRLEHFRCIDCGIDFNRRR